MQITKRKIRQRDLVPNLAKRIAEELAPKTYSANRTRIEERRIPKMVGTIQLIDEHGFPAFDTVNVSVRFVQNCPVNHERRLRRLGNKAGVNAMFDYAADNGYKPEIDHLATR